MHRLGWPIEKPLYPHRLRGRGGLIALSGLLALTLFPVEWLGLRYQTLARVFDALATDLYHAIGHAALFATLGWVVLRTVPALRARPWLYVGLLTLTAVAQECFQLLFKQRPLVFDDGRDLAIDIVAFSLSYGVHWWLGRRRNA